MRKTTGIHIVVLLSCLMHAVRVSRASSTADFSGVVATVDLKLPIGCRGASTAECLAGDDEGLGLELAEMEPELEMEMDSEINRRLLFGARRYISYGALRRDVVPCSRRGASYYNCRTGAPANPYTRACSRITRCRR